MMGAEAVVDSMAHIPVEFLNRPDLLMQRLTKQVVKGMGSSETLEMIQLFRNNTENALSIPREFFFQNMAKTGWRWKDNTSFPELNTPLKFHGTLDPKRDQVNSVNTMLKHFTQNYGGILQAPAGTGKTVMGLAIAAAMGTRVLILVHSEFLVAQWQERIEQFLKVKSGTIQQDTVDIDYPIVIGMTQSIMSRDYDPKIFESFGLVIGDECHSLGAKEYHKAVLKNPARYRLGLSATPRRKDGLEDVFKWHIGPLVYCSKSETLTPIVYQYETESTLPSWLNSRGREMKAKMVSMLADDAERTDKVAELLHKAALAGRRIIVFSERRTLLSSIHGRLKDDVEMGFYWGGLTQEQRDEAAEKQVILSTYQFAREALDIPQLDTVFLATPVADVEQAIGRILRKHERKKRPLVIDFVDGNNSYLRGLGFYRRSNYQKWGYELKSKEIAK